MGYIPCSMDHIPCVEDVTENNTNAITLQALEISQASVYYDVGGEWNEDGKIFYRNTAAQQLQLAILGLQLTSLKLLGVDCGCQILPEHATGSLAKLRCFPLYDVKGM